MCGCDWLCVGVIGCVWVRLVVAVCGWLCVAGCGCGYGRSRAVGRSMLTGGTRAVAAAEANKGAADASGDADAVAAAGKALGEARQRWDALQTLPRRSLPDANYGRTDLISKHREWSLAMAAWENATEEKDLVDGLEDDWRGADTCLKKKMKTIENLARLEGKAKADRLKAEGAVPGLEAVAVRKKSAYEAAAGAPCHEQIEALRQETINCAASATESAMQGSRMLGTLAAMSAEDRAAALATMSAADQATEVAAMSAERARGRRVIPMSRSENRLAIDLISQQHQLQVVGGIQLPRALLANPAFVCNPTMRGCSSRFLDSLLDILLNCPNLRHASLYGTCKVWSSCQVDKLCRLIRERLMSANLGEIDFTPSQLVSVHCAISDSLLGAVFFDEKTWLIEIGAADEFKQATIKLLRTNRAKPAYENFMLTLTPTYVNYVKQHNFWKNPFSGFWGVIMDKIQLGGRDAFYVEFQKMRSNLTPSDRASALKAGSARVTLAARTELLCQQLRQQGAQLH